MTPHMEQLTASRDRLTTAISRITNVYQTNTNRLEELERSLPDLIAAIALEETDSNKLDEARQEISRLRAISKEPYPQAIKRIDASRALISEQINKAVREQAAIDQEREFRVFFNHCLETRSRKTTDWELLRNSAQHWHRRDVDTLDAIHYEFENKGFHYKPDSPTFVEFAASKGLLMYNLNLTYENITQPKER